MNRAFIFSGLLLLVASIFGACEADKGKYIPDVSTINVDVDIRHFEQDLFALDTNDMAAGLAALSEKYPTFSKVYFSQVMGATDPRYAPDGPEAYIKGFLSHPAVRQLYDTTMVLYKDFEAQERHFKETFQFFKHYFPEYPTPTVTTYISEYSYAAFIYDTTALAVGLDFFLGNDYPYMEYNPNNPNFSAYLTRAFNEDHLVLKTTQPLVEDLVGTPKGNRLLDLMVHEGKKLYIQSQLMPHASDTIIMEYTPQQLKWVRDSELEIWAYLLDKEYLYSTNYADIRKLLEYSPKGNSDMPADAPGRTATWLGWQIVKTYMARHPKATLQDLMALNDAQQLLDKSKYKPVR